MKTFFLLVLAVAAHASICKTEQEPKLVTGSSVEYQYVWEVEDKHSKLFRPTNEFDKKLEPFIDWVKTFAPIEQEELLKIQKDYSEAAGIKQYVKRGKLILENKLGVVMQPNCLEQFIFTSHHELFPQMDYPAEFMATVLQSKTNRKLFRIFYSFGDGRRFNVSPPPYSNDMYVIFNRDIESGKWLPYTYVHSHPFMIKYEHLNEDGSFTPLPHIGGTVMPSDEDVNAYVYFLRDFGMKEVSITTGLSSIRFSQSEAKLLESTLTEDNK